MAQILLKSWKPGLLKISLVKLLQKEAGLSLTSAKQVVDRLLKGESVTVNIASTDRAKLLAAEIAALGAVCEVIPDESQNH
jgi:ribosomal protein L7/L12